MTFHKRAVVTGAAKGIGFATARELLSGGADVYLVDIDESALKAAAGELRGLPGRVCAGVCDVADESAVHSTAADIESRLGGADILVNNAGVFNGGALFEESDSAEWRRKIGINILGTMYFTKALLGGMLRRGFGRIVNLGSVAAVYGLDTMVDYSMTKGAVVSFTLALAREVTPRGVTVNAVSPGTIGGEPRPIALNKAGRTGTYEECASLICYLASDEAGYISGQNYVIDGQRNTVH